jgi:hypothetical protein
MLNAPNRNIYNIAIFCIDMGGKVTYSHKEGYYLRSPTKCIKLHKSIGDELQANGHLIHHTVTMQKYDPART